MQKRPRSRTLSFAWPYSRFCWAKLTTWVAVFYLKKRLNSNEHRLIILAKGGKYWIYEYLFAKKDRENIENDELLAFRLLAKSYAGLTAHQVGQLLKNGSFVEICHDDKTEIQE